MALAMYCQTCGVNTAEVKACSTWVAAVGSDGYVATVTPAEAWPGGRPLLISLSEDGTPLSAPRLVTDGDIKGGRYVSGVYDLVVGQGAPANRPRPCHGLASPHPDRAFRAISLMERPLTFRPCSCGNRR